MVFIPISLINVNNSNSNSNITSPSTTSWPLFYSLVRLSSSFLMYFFVLTSAQCTLLLQAPPPPLPQPCLTDPGRCRGAPLGFRPPVDECAPPRALRSVLPDAPPPHQTIQ
eukprot:GCRY01003818.1.p2 GENE.GCRY01003818.1~~GCRY01003818.1.p2  ORF type:complete len:111 (-),score=4.79 GCRY01003818.1:1542-1874(-)